MKRFMIETMFAKRKHASVKAAAVLSLMCLFGASVQADELMMISEAADVLTSDGVLTGTYTAAEGWSEDLDASDEEKKVYKQTDLIDQDETSTITCSYLDTNYSVLEYEQLRDMLANNLIYSHVNAQIATSAVYTKAKDYLYIVTVDDSAVDYREVHYYVVGDYRCFSIEVHEYRAEAEAAKSQEQQTPQEAGQKMAEEFVWNAAW